jgi:diacylglycerol O-acyltransferase
VIEGSDGSTASDGGRLAVMLKVHHAAVDGVAAANLPDKLVDNGLDVSGA